MLDKETAKFILSNLKVRQQLLAGGTPEMQAGFERALGVMQAIADGDTIASLWSVEDVYSLHTNDDGDELGDIDLETARRVLELADREHDASIGINWDSLGYWLEYVEGGE